METSLETFGNVLETGEGNTKLPPRARCVPSKYWCFTYFHNNVSEMETLETLLKKFKYIFGIEVCPETKRSHLQGYVDFEKKVRPSETIKIKEIHWEKCKGSKEQNIKYCSKDGKFRTNIKVPKPILDPMEGLTRKPWQIEIDNIIANDVNRRKIYWYWEEEGNQGKTSYTKHICMNHNALMVNGKAADIKHGFTDWIKAHGEIDIAIFHFVRSEEEYISYAAIENLQDGIFFSTKYESSMLIFNPPHMICFANFAPKLGKCSKDRWIVTNIQPSSTPPYTVGDCGGSNRSYSDDIIMDE